jgi:hypothetical protein
MHITDNQILLYLTRYGLTKEKREGIDNHLLTCAECNTRKDKYFQLLADMQRENKIECTQTENMLVDYRLERLSEAQIQKIEAHLETCDSCKFISERLNFGVLSDVKEKSRTSISDQIQNELERLLHQVKSKLVTFAILIIQPLEPAPAFLGRPTRGLKQVTHNGGSLVLNIGGADHNVHLYSMNAMKLDSRKSDEFGIVTFDDFLPGDYQIQVDGYRIDNIEYMKS